MGAGGGLGFRREASTGREKARPPVPGVLPRNHAGAEVLGACLAGLASSDTGGPQPGPNSAFSSWNPCSILLANSIQKNQNTEEKTMIITKRMKEPTNQSNPWRHPLPLSEANCSSVLLHLRTLAQQGPAAPLTGRCSPQSAPSLPQGSPWQRLGVVLWMASGVLASLSCHSCH